MRPFKSPPLLGAPDEAQCGHHVAKQNHNEGHPDPPPTSERCAKRGHPGLISSLALGVNRAK